MFSVNRDTIFLKPHKLLSEYREDHELKICVLQEMLKPLQVTTMQLLAVPHILDVHCLQESVK